MPTDAPELRYAFVSPMTRALADALLPDNYRLVGTLADGKGSIIAGHDIQGWRLELHVLPRLAAARCDCRELDASEAKTLLARSDP